MLLLTFKWMSKMVQTPHTTKLQEGEKAPDFSFLNADGKVSSLKYLLGKKVILYFYPKDDTPGCTTESCNLRDNYQLLQKEGYEVFGVSKDDEKSHRKFKDKYKLPFHLIPDTDLEIIKSYDVWGEKKFMGRTFDGIVRTTFVINEKGIIAKVIRKVDNENHAEQILTNS